MAPVEQLVPLRSVLERKPVTDDRERVDAPFADQRHGPFPVRMDRAETGEAHLERTRPVDAELHLGNLARIRADDDDASTTTDHADRRVVRGGRADDLD